MVHPNGGAGDEHLAALRRALVEGLQQRGLLADERIAAAFAAIPRHRFLPAVAPEEAYSDQAILTKVTDGVGLSSSSQPAMMAIMLQQLMVDPGQRVLEIGAGTGFNAALLRYLVGARGRVTTVDVDDDIVDAARAHLAGIGYHDVRVILGDGGFGWAADAPYDRIILTVGAADVLPAWVAQLRPDGLLVLPLQIGPGMLSVALRKLPDGTLISESLSPCGFIRLRGAFASAEQAVRLGDWTAEVEPGPRLDPGRLAALLAEPVDTLPLPGDLAGALLFLRFCGEPMARLLHWGASGGTEPESAWDGFLDTAAMSGCLLPAWAAAPSAALPAGQVFGARDVAERIARYLAHWEALGRPQLGDLRILVLPMGTPAPAPGTLAIARPNATLVLARRDGRAFVQGDAPAR